MGFGFGHASHHPVVASRRDAKREPRSYSAFQGACVVMAGCALVVGLSFIAMVALTGPDGWLTKAANTALLGDSSAVMTAYTEQGR